MRRPTRANTARTTNNRPARASRPQTTKAQVRLSMAEFGKIMGWPEASDEMKALEFIMRTVNGAGRQLNRIVSKYRWTQGKERFFLAHQRNHPCSWQQAMTELVKYEKAYEKAGKKQGKKSVSAIANSRPEVPKLPKAQRELILKELKDFFGSDIKVHPHPGDKPEEKEALKQWHRELTWHREELEWSKGFPSTTLGYGTLLSLFLIKLCSTEQDWGKFQEAWNAVEGGIELPEVVLKLRIGPKPEQEQQEERASA